MRAVGVQSSSSPTSGERRWGGGFRVHDSAGRIQGAGMHRATAAGGGGLGVARCSEGWLRNAAGGGGFDVACCLRRWPRNAAGFLPSQNCRSFTTLKASRASISQNTGVCWESPTSLIGSLSNIFTEGQAIISHESARSREGRFLKKRVNLSRSAINQGGEHDSLVTDDRADGEMGVIASADAQETPRMESMPLKALVPKLEPGDPVTRVGQNITAGYFIVAVGALLWLDSSLWWIVQQPLASYYLTLPFLLSAAVTGIVGYFCVPVLKKLKADQVFRREGPAAHLLKSGTPTMGGMFFVPVGVAIAWLFTQVDSIEVHGVITVTLVYAGIGLLDDALTLWRRHNYGLPGWIKLMLQVAAGTIFSLWLETANLPLRRNILSLPAPFEPLQLGRWYLPLTAFCCAAMSNGVNLTDGLDGLAGGTAAAAFLSMAVAVLPNYPALGVFGSSMAGACFGFLVHNRYKAKVFMGDTGSLALGGALAAMAGCSGLFLPLLIASGLFVLETISVMGQVFYFKLTKSLYGQGRRWLRMAPFHHHLEFLGMKEPSITSAAYAVGSALAVLAAYIGLSCAKVQF